MGGIFTSIYFQITPWGGVAATITYHKNEGESIRISGTGLLITLLNSMGKANISI